MGANYDQLGPSIVTTLPLAKFELHHLSDSIGQDVSSRNAFIFIGGQLKLLIHQVEAEEQDGVSKCCLHKAICMCPYDRIAVMRHN